MMRDVEDPGGFELRMLSVVVVGAKHFVASKIGKAHGPALRLHNRRIGYPRTGRLLENGRAPRVH